MRVLTPLVWRDGGGNCKCEFKTTLHKTSELWNNREVTTRGAVVRKSAATAGNQELKPEEKEYIHLSPNTEKDRQWVRVG